MKTVIDDVKSQNLTFTKAVQRAQNPAGYKWCQALLWSKPEMKMTIG